MNDYFTKVLSDMASAQIRQPPISVVDFKSGDKVIYLPHHAHGDMHHPDCEKGVVTSINAEYVFVRFRPRSANGEACDPRQLVRQSEEGTE